MKYKGESLLARALLSLVMFGVSISAHAASEHFRVHVIVRASDEQTMERITSDVNRQLRSLGDVDVVDSDPDFEIAAVVIQTKTRYGNIVDYTMATVILARFDNSTLVPAVQSQFQEEAKSATSALYYFPKTSLEIGPNLEELAKNAIAEFDTQTLGPARKLGQQMQDIMKKMKK